MCAWSITHAPVGPGSTLAGCNLCLMQVSLILERIDTNQDGVIQYKELAQACRTFGAARQPDRVCDRSQSRNNDRGNQNIQNSDRNGERRERGTTPGRDRAGTPGKDRAGTPGRDRPTTPGRRQGRPTRAEASRAEHSPGRSSSRGPARGSGSRGASPRRTKSPGRSLTESRAEERGNGGNGVARGSIYYSRFRKGYTRLVEGANKSLAEVTEHAVHPMSPCCAATPCVPCSMDRSMS